MALLVGKPYRDQGASFVMGDDGDSKALLYMAVGALAAVGAGYLVWKYGMTEESRRRTIEALREARKGAMAAVASATTMAKESMGDWKGSLGEMTESARDGATQVRAKAMKSAGEMGQRLRP
jgi:hypothetical protein